jgi:allantoate deiminase
MNESLSGQGAQIIARCRQLATFSEIPGEITRTFLSAPMRDVHALIRKWMESAGMTVSIDAIGSIRGLYPGPTFDSPRLLIGSHLDTVPNAGAFDGPLGVLLGIAVVEQLRGKKLPFAIEVIGFSEEEGVRFARPFLSSLAVTGQLDSELLARKDAAGITVAEAISNFDLNPTDLPLALLSPLSFAYLEFHIEQGPVLEADSASLGVVDAIIGQSRLELTFTGHANHAGTTPMHLRHDALAAASEWIVEVEAYAQTIPSLVATVGKIHAEPNAGNVVPGLVTTSLDVRHADDTIRYRAVSALLESASSAATKRGVQLTSRPLLDQSTVPMDLSLTHLLQTAAQQAGHPSRIMPSGAGHDAMILAPHIPSTMLFLRSPGGLSHHPDESVLPEDVEAALATALHFLTLLCGEHAIL